MEFGIWNLEFGIFKLLDRGQVVAGMEVRELVLCLDPLPLGEGRGGVIPNPIDLP